MISGDDLDKSLMLKMGINQQEYFMYRYVSKLLVYRNIGADSILFRLADIIKDMDSGHHDKDQICSRFFDEINRLLLLATEYGFDQNIWYSYIAYLLAMTENPFTLCTEKRGAVDGTVNQLVMNDFRSLKAIMDYDFSRIENYLSVNYFTLLKDYNAVRKQEEQYNVNVSLRISELKSLISKAKNAEELFDAAMDFYKKYGVGSFGMNKAFRVDNNRILVPIMTTSDVTFDGLAGYERQKQELIGNTEAFVSGKAANNVLLYGDAGTGKSTSVKALLNMFYDEGIRIIEIYKHDFKLLPEIISKIKGRNYRFIIYMDDLSFESMETDYKYLKAVIEGGMEVRPANVLIYATSNRRHLIHETFTDRGDGGDDIHKNETMAERMSLSARFGLTIGYFRPEKAEYYEIVKKLVEKKIQDKMSEEELLARADVWALRHGGMSGRVAKQFADFLGGLS